MRLAKRSGDAAVQRKMESLALSVSSSGAPDCFKRIIDAGPAALILV